MAVVYSIQYLKRDEIIEGKWNRCVEMSSNGRIYSSSRYLDRMAANWDALVLNDYEAVMPLPWKKKWGIHYIYQPFLTAQLGLFGNNLDAELMKAFFDAIPAKFKLWEFPLNQSNRFNIEAYPLYERRNFILSLNKDYKELYKGYRENIRRNIKKSEQYGCYSKQGINIRDIINIVKEQQPFNEQDLLQFEKLFNEFLIMGRAKTYGVFSSNNELLASAAFLFSNRRAYYILVGNSPNGRTLGASHALIDAFIKDHSCQEITLDFEGSDIRNLAFFYSSFGATEEMYTAIKRNMLPWYVKLFKK